VDPIFSRAWQVAGVEAEGLREKKEAARSRIPGKNPKTQREEQSGRLVLRRAEHAPVATRVNGNLCEKTDFFRNFSGDVRWESAEEASWMAICGMDLRFFY
jgi:hypothetical protein